MFPPKKEIVTNTETRTVEGPTIYHFDTVTADCDTVYKVGGKRIVRIPCPPSTHKTDTVFTTTTVTTTKTDEKQVMLLQKQLAASESDTDKFKSRSRKQWWAIGIMGAIIAGSVAMKFVGRANPLGWLKRKQA
jgi:hypothetical protein